MNYIYRNQYVKNAKGIFVGVPYRNEDNNLHRKLVKAAGGIRQYKRYIRNGNIVL